MPDFNDELYTDIEHMCFLTYGQAGQVLLGLILTAIVLTIIFKLTGRKDKD